jgi:hypothetical protein
LKMAAGLGCGSGYSAWRAADSGTIAMAMLCLRNDCGRPATSCRPHEASKPLYGREHSADRANSSLTDVTMGARITPRKGVGTLPKFVRVASTKQRAPPVRKPGGARSQGRRGAGRSCLLPAIMGERLVGFSIRCVSSFSSPRCLHPSTPR